ncbi:MAG: hypothetical protein Q3966_04675 [Neisseria sp.]|nr:hypothetical protein [Neisseria sp.]
MKPLLIGSFAILLAACSSNAPPVRQEAAYDSGSQARVRLYGQNQKPAYLISGIDCENQNHGTKVGTGGSLGDAFGSLVGTAKSQSLGIPETEHSRNIGKTNGILSRAFFREYIVPADKAANVQAAYIGLTTVSETPTVISILEEGSCNSRMASFVPKAGHDYEVIGLTGKACAVAVYEVGKDGGLTPVPLQNAVSCSKR